jgi:hypothetical protein
MCPLMHVDVDELHNCAGAPARASERNGLHCQLYEIVFGPWPPCRTHAQNPDGGLLYTFSMIGARELRGFRLTQGCSSTRSLCPLIKIS